MCSASFTRNSIAQLQSFVKPFFTFAQKIFPFPKWRPNGVSGDGDFTFLLTSGGQRLLFHHHLFIHHKISPFLIPSFLCPIHFHEFFAKKSSILILYKSAIIRYNITVGKRICLNAPSAACTQRAPAVAAEYQAYDIHLRCTEDALFSFFSAFGKRSPQKADKIYIICKKIKIPMEICADLWYTIV